MFGELMTYGSSEGNRRNVFKHNVIIFLLGLTLRLTKMMFQLEDGPVLLPINGAKQ